MDPDAVAATVEELARVLRADGGDLVLVDANTRRATISLRLVLDQVSCEACVLPPDMLFDTVQQSLADCVRDEFELVIDDPRRAGPPPG
jgi:Fe-S cluster biogenesis protein NfuA